MKNISKIIIAVAVIAGAISLQSNAGAFRQAGRQLGRYGRKYAGRIGQAVTDKWGNVIGLFKSGPLKGYYGGFIGKSGGVERLGERIAKEGLEISKTNIRRSPNTSSSAGVRAPSKVSQFFGNLFYGKSGYPKHLEKQATKRLYRDMTDASLGQSSPQWGQYWEKGAQALRPYTGRLGQAAKQGVQATKQKWGQVSGFFKPGPSKGSYGGLIGRPGELGRLGERIAKEGLEISKTNIRRSPNTSSSADVRVPSKSKQFFGKLLYGKTGYPQHLKDKATKRLYEGMTRKSEQYFKRPTDEFGLFQ